MSIKCDEMIDFVDICDQRIAKLTKQHFPRELSMQSMLNFTVFTGPSNICP